MSVHEKRWPFDGCAFLAERVQCKQMRPKSIFLATFHADYRGQTPTLSVSPNHPNTVTFVSPLSHCAARTLNDRTGFQLVARHNGNDDGRNRVQLIATDTNQSNVRICANVGFQPTRESNQNDCTVQLGYVRIKLMEIALLPSPHFHEPN